MVNHFRTLLLNFPASAQDAVGHGQFIPSDFYPVPMNSVQAAIYAGVFPRADLPTNYMNFIANVLSCVAYNTPYADFIDDLVDDRKTYDPTNYQSQSLIPFKESSFTALSGKIFLGGSFIPTNDLGLFEEGWTLSRVNANTINVFRDFDQTQVQRSITWTGDVSSEFEIGSGITGQIVGESGATIPVGFTANVTAAVPMKYSIYSCLERLKSSAGGTQIFNTSNQSFSARMETLKNVYENSGLPHHQLSAILVAQVLSLTINNGLIA